MTDEINRRDFGKVTGAAAAVAATGLSIPSSQAQENKEKPAQGLLPLRQKTEFGRLREVVLGRTQRASMPPKSPANAAFTDKIKSLGPDFYDQFEEGEEIPISDHVPELIDFWEQCHNDLTKAYESEGVIVQRIMTPTKSMLNYFGFRPHGYWPFSIANFWQIFGNVVVETGVSDNIMACTAATFAGRDLLLERFDNDPDAILLSALPGCPTDGVKEGKGPGPWLTCGDIRLIDEKNVLVGNGLTEGKKDTSASNARGVEILRRILKPFGFEVHRIDYDAKYSFHFDYILGLCAPGVATTPVKAYIGGIPEVLKDWDLIDITQDECATHGAGNLVPLGPDDKGKHRVMTPIKTDRVNKEIEKRGVRTVNIETEIGAGFGAGIRCATLVTNRDD